MHSYYKKVCMWTILNTTGTGIMAYVFEQNWKSVLLFTMAQATVTFSIYSPFEYYWTWTPESPCILDIPEGKN